jgi:hypothetical protein
MVTRNLYYLKVPKAYLYLLIEGQRRFLSYTKKGKSNHKEVSLRITSLLSHRSNYSSCPTFLYLFLCKITIPNNNTAVCLSVYLSIYLQPLWTLAAFSSLI